LSALSHEPCEVSVPLSSARSSADIRRPRGNRRPELRSFLYEEAGEVRFTGAKACRRPFLLPQGEGCTHAGPGPIQKLLVYRTRLCYHGHWRAGCSCASCCAVPCFPERRMSAWAPSAPPPPPPHPSSAKARIIPYNSISPSATRGLNAIAYIPTDS
jgi:hypothetical protein